MSQFDVSISPKTILSVVDCFRYQITNSDFFLAQSTFGIWICDNSGKPLKSFNTVSQQLSQRSDIFALKIVSQIPPLLYSSASDVSYPASNSGILWAAQTENSITYSYRYLKDDEEITSNLVLKGLVGGKEFDRVHGESGIHMTLGATTIGNKARLLLKRSGSLGTKYVILPMCGAKVAFDSGISIAGYKWVDSISEL